MKQVIRLCKSKFCRKQPSKQLCYRKWAKPENNPTVVSSTSRYSLQIREKNLQLPCDPCRSCPSVQSPHQQQPRSFTAAWCLLNPCAVFLVHNLEGFVICQACLNVRALQIFKCFCHTHRALAELLCLKPLLGCCGRGLTFWPLWVLSACSWSLGSALLWGLRSHLSTNFPSLRHVGTQNFSVCAFRNM